MAHPLEHIMPTTISELHQLADVDTVVGKPVHVDENTCIIPVSRASLGFVTGGGEYGLKSGGAATAETGAYPFAGTTGAGVTLTPVAFLSVTAEGVRLLPVEEREPYMRAAALLPELIREVTDAIRSLRGQQDE